MSDDPIAAALRRVVSEEIQRATFRPEGPRWLTFDQSCEYLGISDRYLRDLVSRGVFQVMRHKEGGTKYLDSRDLDEYTVRAKGRSDAA